MDLLRERRDDCAQRLAALRRDLADAEAMAGANACVYLTGSAARGEASVHSDLDLFIVGKEAEVIVDGEAKRVRALSRLDEICIKADLIEATRKHGFPQFSGDGEYLVHHTAGDLVRTLGKPEDDASNTFTARLLLLLESRPLLGEPVYDEVIKEVVAAYWRDYQDHSSDFMPAFLANDILRLWRTFCVNYEARTATEPAEKKAKRKLKNYKLKHSRLLTCYSALTYLLVVFQKKRTVRPEDVLHMVQLSPTERIEWTGAQESSVQPHVCAVLDRYRQFLAATDRREAELIAAFRERDSARDYLRQAGELGDKVYELLSALGAGSKFYRLLLI
jgi:predicted nucleotidyltransferase